MLRNRIIPILLLDNNDLVKTFKFKKKYYLGDPINSVRIFNEKEVDELAFLDISSNRYSIIVYSLLAPIFSVFKFIL